MLDSVRTTAVAAALLVATGACTGPNFFAPGGKTGDIKPQISIQRQESGSLTVSNPHPYPIVARVVNNGASVAIPAFGYYVFTLPKGSYVVELYVATPFGVGRQLGRGSMSAE